MSVRMSELADPEQPAAAPPTRTEPYERTPPPAKEHHYRKAWVGSASAYDAAGNELHTWRYAVEADADPAQLADRVAADVAWLLRAHPGVPLHCIQDAAPELRALPEALERALPVNTNRVDLVDFEHLMGYLEDVVDACEPEGDPHAMKGWYRNVLLRTMARSITSELSGQSRESYWESHGSRLDQFSISSSGIKHRSQGLMAREVAPLRMLL